MAIVNKFEYEDRSIKAYYVDEIAVLKFKGNAFDMICDLEVSGHNFFLIDQANNNPAIKCIIFFNENDTFGDSFYEKFAQNIMENCGCDKERKKLPDYEKRFIRSREIKMLDRVIVKMMQSKKIIIAAFRGDVVTPFIGCSLVADFRYFAEGSILNFSHVRYGFHPSGASAYFLPKFIGRQRLSNICLGGNRSGLRRHWG